MRIWFLLAIGLLWCSVAAAQPRPTTVERVRLLGTIRAPSGAGVSGAPVGGLSGLDYDEVSDCWIAISDDRSEHAPARFFTLRLDYDGAGIHSLDFTGVTFLKQRDGSVYPKRADGPKITLGEIADCEAVRIDPRDRSLWYTSEGDEERKTPPWVRQASHEGSFRFEMPLPLILRLDSSGHSGPRFNLNFEGLSFTPDGEGLWLGLEEPLIQDGPRPSADYGPLVRCFLLNRQGEIRRECAYRLDTAYLLPAPGKRASNGLAEILALSENKLLILERAGAEQADGSFHFALRLYEADFTAATDVTSINSLTDQSAIQTATKRLVVDFQTLIPSEVDNLEGLAWGRRLPNGHDTLVVVSDDNFDRHQVTEFHVLEILPAEDAERARVTRKWDDPFEGVVHDERRVAGFVGSYRWLSNFYPCRLEFEGLVYRSAEAAYQASKYPFAQRAEFTTLDADSAKKRSRQKGVDQSQWDARKDQVMRDVLWAKFAQNPELAEKLVATGERQLEETNWWGDKYWGVFKGEGQNALGKLLTETRAKLRGKERREGK